MPRRCFERRRRAAGPACFANRLSRFPCHPARSPRRGSCRCCVGYSAWCAPAEHPRASTCPVPQPARPDVGSGDAWAIELPLPLDITARISTQPGPAHDYAACLHAAPDNRFLEAVRANIDRVQCASSVMLDDASRAVCAGRGQRVCAGGPHPESNRFAFHVPLPRLRQPSEYYWPASLIPRLYWQRRAPAVPANKASEGWLRAI